MKKSSLFGGVAALAVGGALSALVLTAPSYAHFPSAAGSLTAGPAASVVLAPAAGQTTQWGVVPNLADLVETVSPSVVQIIVRSNPQGRQATGGGANPFEGTPFEDFFNRNFQGDRTPNEMPSQVGSGSGFFIEGGYIVTNHHVVDNARRVTVRFSDDHEVEATLVGSDEKTDLAVLKLDGQAPQKALAWGDSDRARPGDSVFAMGSPFGLGNTVTSGIVSARGRYIGGQYDDFIQVDAPINRGNSGGPLFNAAGQVIGVNSAIYSPSGGSVGVGFSIPSDLAQSIVKQLIDHGAVERGWLGVEIQGVSPDIARSLGLNGPKGAMVARVTDGSPAAKAGVRTGDVILTFGGGAIGSVSDLTRAVADTRAGTTRDLRVLRDGREQTLKVKIAALEPVDVSRTALASNTPSAAGAKGTLSLTSLGVDLASDGASGVVVAAVKPNSAAADSSVRPGDRIVKVNQTEVSSPEAVRKAVDDVRKQKRDAVLLQIERDGRTSFVGVPLRAD